MQSKREVSGMTACSGEAHRLAGLIQAHIASEQLAAGARLGRERDLIQWSGRSRATVREAVRLLADQGLVATRPGPAGGIFVAAPGPEHVARSLGILLESTQVSLAELLEARVEIEAAAAALAARRREPGDVAALAASCERFARLIADGHHVGQVEENLVFHAAVASACHNPVLSALHDAIRDLVRVSTVEPAYEAAVAREVLGAHERIAAAIAAGDEAAAARRVRRHLAAFETYLRGTNQYQLIRQRFRL